MTMPATTIEPKAAIQREGAKRRPDLANLLIDEISVGDDNHRMEIDEEALATLRASIAEHGLQSPILVGMERDGTYTLIYGHRRLEAVKRLGWTSVDCFVAALPEDVHERARFIHEQRAIENLDRENLTAIDEALAVAALVNVEVDRLGMNPDTCEPRTISQACEAVAGQIGRSATWVRDRAYISRLSGHARNLVQAGRLPLGHAREICKIADPKQRDDLAQFAARQPEGNGGVSLDWIRRRVQERMHSLRSVPWSLVDSFAGCPACESCPHNSANDLHLFEHDKAAPETGTCLNPRCFDVKSRAVQRAMKAAAEKVAKYCKAHKVAATPSVAGQVPGVPAHVKPASVARLAKVTIEGKPAAPSGGSTYKRSPQEIAEGQYHEARRKWNGAAQKAFEAELATWAGPALLVLALASEDSAVLELLPRDSISFNNREPWRSGYAQEQRRVAAGFNTPAARRSIAAIHSLRSTEDETLQGLLKPVRKRLVETAAGACVSWASPTWTLAMAKAFRVTLPEPPKWEPPSAAKKKKPAGNPPRKQSGKRPRPSAAKEKKAPAKKAAKAAKPARSKPRRIPSGVAAATPHPANDPYLENDD